MHAEPSQIHGGHGRAGDQAAPASSKAPAGTVDPTTSIMTEATPRQAAFQEGSPPAWQAPPEHHYLDQQAQHPHPPPPQSQRPQDQQQLGGESVWQGEHAPEDGTRLPRLPPGFGLSHASPETFHPASMPHRQQDAALMHPSYLGSYVPMHHLNEQPGPSHHQAHYHPFHPSFHPHAGQPPPPHHPYYTHQPPSSQPLPSQQQQQQQQPNEPTFDHADFERRFGRPGPPHVSHLPPYLMTMSSPIAAASSHFSPFSPLTPESIRHARDQDALFAAATAHLPPLAQQMPYPHHPHSHPHPPPQHPPSQHEGHMRYDKGNPSTGGQGAAGYAAGSTALSGIPKGQPALPPKEALRLAVPQLHASPLADSPSTEQIRSIEREISRLLFSPTASEGNLTPLRQSPHSATDRPNSGFASSLSHDMLPLTTSEQHRISAAHASDSSHAASAPRLQSPTAPEQPMTRVTLREKRLREPGPDFFVALNRQIEDLIKEMEPHQEEYARWTEVVNETERQVKACFPDALLHQFGSTANGLSTRAADIDLCLSFPADSPHYNVPAAETVQTLGDFLKEREEAPTPAQTSQRTKEESKVKSRFSDFKVLTRTRIPIVKFKDSVSGCQIDIGCNNLLAVENTRLLKAYAQIDDRFRQAALVIKHWTKQRGIADTYNGTLSSYAYNLMLIHYMQWRCQPAVLPNLQALAETVPVDQRRSKHALLAPFQTDFLENVHYLPHVWPGYRRNTQSIAELVYGFFVYYAFEFEFKDWVASVRVGRAFLKTEKGWFRTKADLLAAAQRPRTAPASSDTPSDTKKERTDEKNEERDANDEPIKTEDASKAKDDNTDTVALTINGAQSTPEGLADAHAIADVTKEAAEEQSTGSPDDTEKEHVVLDRDEEEDQEEDEQPTSGGEAKKEQEQTLERFAAKQRFWFCVEDPFETEHNLGRVVDRNGLYLVRGEFITAVNFLASFAPKSGPGMPFQRPRIFMHYPPPHYQGVLKRLCRHWEDEKDAQSRMVSRQQVQQSSGKDSPHQRQQVQDETSLTGSSTSGGRKGKTERSSKPAEKAENVFEHGRDRRDISRAVREKQNRHHMQPHRQHQHSSQQGSQQQAQNATATTEKKREKAEKKK